MNVGDDKGKILLQEMDKLPAPPKAVLVSSFVLCLYNIQVTMIGKLLLHQRTCISLTAPEHQMQCNLRCMRVWYEAMNFPLAGQKDVRPLPAILSSAITQLMLL
jgi:hypothetical protein